MNLEQELLKYIERFKKKNNGKDKLLNNYVILYLIGNDFIKNKNKNKNIDIKKKIKENKLEDPFYIDKIILFCEKKKKTLKNLIEYLVNIFYERDYIHLYNDKIEHIKNNTKNVKINIINKKNTNAISNIIENIYKLDFEDKNIDIFMQMILSKNKIIYDKSNLDKLFESKFLIPITIEFNRIHKSSYKTEIIKTSNRANKINEKIKSIKENINDINNFIDINNYYSILYNKKEEINIIHRFLTEDGYFIKNIDNRESYIELKKNHDIKYFNFNKNQFMYNTNIKMISMRKPLNNKYENKLEIRNIKKNENIDIIGFILNKNIKDILFKRENSFKVINYFNKNLKCIFQKNINFIYLNDNNNNANLINIFELIINFIKKYVMKKKLMHKYDILFSKKEKCFFDIYKMYHLPQKFSNTIIDLNNKKMKNEKITAKEKNINNYKILENKKVQEIQQNTNKNKSTKVCIHILELNEKKDYFYIIDKYGKYTNELFVCKYCNAIILNNNSVVYNNEDNSSAIIDIYSEFSYLEEDDILEIERISKKLCKILKISLLNDRKKMNYFLYNLIKLIQNHNNLQSIKIEINNNILINKDINQKIIILVYISILILIQLSKTDINSFYKVDNICNYKNFEKHNYFFDKLFIQQINLKKYDILSYCIFSFACIIVKYILNVQDKTLFNKNIKLFILIFISIMNKILSSEDKIYNKYKNIFLYKLSSLYKFKLKEKKERKTIIQQTSKYNYNRKKYENIKYVFYNKKYKKHNFNVKFDIHKKKNIKIKEEVYLKKKKTEIKAIYNNKYIAKYTLSYQQFIDKYNLIEENKYYIDFNLNGYIIDKKIYIENNDISIVTYNKKSLILIYNKNLKIYMYFDKYYLYYVGYSVTKNTKNIEFYKNENVYLKIKLSLKNKLKYLGYTNLFYHTLIDKNIYQTVNTNINKIIYKIHTYLNILKYKMLIKNPRLNYEKKINNFIKQNNKEIYYENEFNISFNIYHEKISDKKFNKNIIIMKDIFENNLFSSLHLQYFYYLLDLIINKNNNLKSILFEIISELFDLYFINNSHNEYKNKYKINYDCYENISNLNLIENEKISENENENENDKNDTFDYNELDIEENPFDSED